MDSNTLSLESISRLRAKGGKRQRRLIEKLWKLTAADRELGLSLCATDGRSIDGRIVDAAERLAKLIDGSAVANC